MEDIFLKKCGNIKWKREFVKELYSLDNKKLLEDVIFNQQPDDWDGYMSTKGNWKANMSLEILEYRLKEIGWLK